MKNLNLIVMLFLSIWTYSAHAEFVEAGNSNIGVNADSIFPVTKSNNMTFYREVEGEREPAMVISSVGDDRIDIRGHANIKSLYLNGKVLFSEDGKYLGNQFVTKDISDSAIDSAKIKDGTLTASDLASSSVESSKIASKAVKSTHIEDNAVKSQHISHGAIDGSKIKRNSIRKDHFSGLEVTNVSQNSSIGIVYAYCPRDSFVITGGCKLTKGLELEISRPSYRSYISGWVCVAGKGSVTAFATCLKGLPIRSTNNTDPD